MAGNGYPLPGSAPATVAVPAPGRGPQRWAGAPSAVQDCDGSVLLAYRVRGEQDVNVIARSTDGERFSVIAEITRDRFGAAMLERPALVRAEGLWRLYVSCATPGSPHWWIGVLEASDPAGLPDATIRPVFAGDECTGMKDPVIRFDGRRWQAWICCHPLDVPGAEDRMTTGYATSADGLSWDWHGTVLTGRESAWDARGARLTSVLADGRASYDGRASAAENWFERTGLAIVEGSRLRHLPGSPVVDARYLEVLTLSSGDYRIYYEARLPDESHELRTELVAAT